MEKIISSAPFFYSASDKAPGTFRIIYTMKDVINGEIFCRAVKDTMERYPYFKVQVKNDGKSYSLLENGRPVVVRNTWEPPVLGTDDVNMHLMAFCYEGKRFAIDLFHGIADGRGIFPLLKTLVYYYCTYRYNQTFSSEGIHLKGEPILKEETEQPYPDTVDGNIKPLGRYVVKEALQLFKDKNAKPNPKRYPIYIDEKAFVHFSKQSDGSPATTIALLMSRALSRIYGRPEHPIVCGLAMDIRSVLKKENNHNSLVSQLFLEYKDSMKSCDIDTQSTMYRGMVILQQQPENIWISVKHNIGFANRIDTLPSIAAKKQFMNAVVERAKSSDTFKVSYTGRTSNGEMDRYIDNISIDVDVDGVGIMLEVSTCNGKFEISFIQEYENEIYLKSFLEELDNNHIAYTLGKPETVKIAKVGF